MTSRMAGTRFRGMDLDRGRRWGVGLYDVDISGEIGKLTINGVNIGPW